MKFTYHHDYPKEQVTSTILDSTLIRRLLRYFYPARWWMALSFLLLLIARILDVLVPLFIGYIVHEILSSPHETSLFPKILSDSLMVFLMLMGSYLLDAGNLFLRNWIAEKAVYQMRTMVFQHIQTMPIRFFDHNPVGRMMTRTIHDVDQIDQMFSQGIIPIVSSFLLFIAIFVAIVWLNGQLALMVLLLIPILGYVTSQFRIKQKSSYEKVRTVLSAMNGFIQEHLMGASTVRHFNLQKQERKKIEEINDDYRMANLESIYNFSSFIASNEFIHQLMLIGSFVLLAYISSSQGGFQAGTFFTFSLYALMVFRPITDLAERYNLLQAAIAAARRVFHILDQPTENDKEINKIHLDKIHHISFDQVWFAYEKEHWVLRGISFEVKEGESLAIVGFTGEGKTTLISLLLRFYEIQRGTIRINGRDIKEYSLSSLRKRFNVVLQDPVIFSGTIAENISLYKPDFPEESLHSSIRYVHLEDFVNRFPDGLDHYLLERGISLSAGQMQLISLARAVAHNGDLFLLDEATANIDLMTEKVIQEVLEKILEQKTSLVIAHRLSTVQHAKRILVLDKGVIQESGTHQELLKLGGIYEKLYRLQFQNKI